MLDEKNVDILLFFLEKTLRELLMIKCWCQCSFSYASDKASTLFCCNLPKSNMIDSL